MSKVVIVAIITTIAFVLCFWLVGGEILNGVATFVYFFVKDSAEVVSETISGVTMAAVGTPGHVKVLYNRPSFNYIYNVKFDEKLVFVSAQSKSDKKIGITEEQIEEIEGLLSKLPSTFGIEFSYPSDSILSFNMINIEKDYVDELSVELSG